MTDHWKHCRQYRGIAKEASERLYFEDDLKKMHGYMMEHQDEEMIFEPKFRKYYYLHYDNDPPIYQFSGRGDGINGCRHPG